MPSRISPNSQVERIRQTVHSMQKRLRSVDALLEEQVRIVELEEDLFRSEGVVINATMRRTIQVCLLAGSALAFVLGYFAGRIV